MSKDHSQTNHLNNFIQTNFESSGEFIITQPTSENDIKIIQSENNLYNYIPIYGMEKQHNDDPARFVRFVVLSDTHLFHDRYNYWYDEEDGEMNNERLENGLKRRDSFEKKANENTKSEDQLIKLPKGDYLIHCGDFSNFCLPNEIIKFNNFLGKIKHRYKAIIVIPGNHEFYADFAGLLLTNVTHYLKNDFLELEDGKIKLFGSRFKPYWTSWLMTGRDREAQTDWSCLTKPWTEHSLEISNSSSTTNPLDILITHQPPNFKDEISRRFFRRGSDSLAEAVKIVKPCVHLFGHNHDVYGAKYSHEFNIGKEIGNTTFISACSIDSHDVMRKVIVFDYKIQN
ncbi:hypothetical protein C9374_001861 [Naegleria lovaniensis]|uniref:Calcineurin-like phosphoesterase domain-containing protein n=1 Tax=Naegleria lovaniensis TaxID=51637 RepID=A0AA88GVV7_NAELO|nr:uncharacterized protein C9374_001861 [Naegleria lovaniensis]KAG2386826.1 hypothetical protein C9374_001861 [Naegleria lovaniensis]